MDGRIALGTGSQLTFHNHEGGVVSYVIKHEIGRGGSCIVYDASYTDNLNNLKLVRIKECYPHALHITRHESGELVVEIRDRQEFESRKQRFIDAYQQNHELFSLPTLTNQVANTSDIYEYNGTVYIVSSYTNSETLATHHCNSLRECLALMVSAGKAVQRIHEAGFLYLDLKPENILTISGSSDLVQLFDFDSMIAMEDLQAAIDGQDLGGIRSSYTKGFAPLEQQTGKMRSLGPHSDVFSFGAVLFYELWGRVPSAFDCEGNATYDFEAMVFSNATFQDKLYRELTSFLHRTLASYLGDRYSSMSEAVSCLEHILNLADEMVPWLYSTPLSSPVFFTGREEELTALGNLVQQPGQHVCSLYGMGGIGKSTLVREYVRSARNLYDAVLFLYDRGEASEMLADDSLIRVNTIEKHMEESVQEYVARKASALRRLCSEQHVLLILDNFSPEHLDAIPSLIDIGWQVLLISRSELPAGLFPSLGLTEMPILELARLFIRYSHCDLASEADMAAFETIARSVGEHTLLVELIGRQIAQEYLSLQEAAELTERVGFSHLSEGRVDYVHDQKSVKATFEAILGQLLEQDRYVGQERHILKLLSLFDAPGIPAQAFRVLADLSEMEAINALEESGWVRVEQNWLSMHPVLREYVEGWSWQGSEDYLASAESFMERLYELIKPEGAGHDSYKQYPKDYTYLWHLLRLAEQVVVNLGITTPASQRLLYRLVIDAPVEQDELMLRRCLILLQQPVYLEPESVLRLHSQAGLLLKRFSYFSDARDIMKRMKAYLAEHPSEYYTSVYHNTKGEILHDQNAEKNWKKCLRHQDKAIAAAKRSLHPEAQKQLAVCLLDKAMTLLDLKIKPNQCRMLLVEAATIVEQISGEYDYERYNLLCITAMYYARVTGEAAKVLPLLMEATRIADVARDSALSYADHLMDQCAPIYYEMRLYEETINVVQEAILLCDENDEISSYRRLRFEAYMFLAQIYAEMGDYIRSAETYDRLEAYREDSPYLLPEGQPICPPDIRELADEQRDGES